jgi:TonB family protein
MVRHSVAGRTQAYGTLELKRTYQHNLLFALLLAGMLHALIIGGAAWYGHPVEVNALPIPDLRVLDATIISILPPMSVKADPSMGPGFTAQRPSGVTGRPIPVPDEVIVDDDQLIATRRELLLLVEGHGGTGGGGRTTGGAGTRGEIALDVGLPAIDSFIPVEVKPLAYYAPAPEYPSLARSGGLTCSVLLRVLIDSGGRVCSVVVVRTSAPGLGFEHAAVASIATWKYRPALQNGKPVAVWENVPVEFRTR